MLETVNYKKKLILLFSGLKKTVGTIEKVHNKVFFNLSLILVLILTGL